jgi:hypothetical protein
MLRLKDLDKFYRSNEGDEASNFLLWANNVSRYIARINTERLFNFIDGLPITDGEKRGLYWHIDAVIGALTGGEGDDIRHYEAINKRSAMSKLRGRLATLVASHKRREAMRPLVEEVDVEFAHLSRRKRSAAVKKALLKREDFIRLLPKDLKDPRFIKGDIESILFPASFDDQLEDDEREDGAPLSDLLRDLGVDPD